MRVMTWRTHVVLTQLHQRVDRPHSTQKAWELVLLDVIQPLIYCIREEFIHPQQPAKKTITK